MAEAWTATHRDDPDAAKKARCPLAREWIKQAKRRKPSNETLRESDAMAHDFYEFVGRCFTDARYAASLSLCAS